MPSWEGGPPLSSEEDRGALTSDGRAKVQDCWKGHEPELSTWILKSTAGGGGHRPSVSLRNWKTLFTMTHAIIVLLRYKTQNLTSIKLLN